MPARSTGVDRDLVEAARNGDREAHADLLGSRAGRLFAIAQRILRDVDRAEDAVQEALVLAWRDLPGLREPDHFDAWLHRLVVRACLAEARKARRLVATLVELPVDISVGRDAHLDIIDRDELERAFRRLPPDQRALLVLRHYAGLETAAIADILGIPDGTVRSRLHHAHRVMEARSTLRRGPPPPEEPRHDTGPRHGPGPCRLAAPGPDRCSRPPPRGHPDRGRPYPASARPRSPPAAVRHYRTPAAGNARRRVDSCCRLGRMAPRPQLRLRRRWPISRTRDAGACRSNVVPYLVATRLRIAGRARMDRARSS